MILILLFTNCFEWKCDVEIAHLITRDQLSCHEAHA